MTYTDEEVLGTTVQLLAELSTRNNENLRLKAINADLLAALQPILHYLEQNGGDAEFHDADGIGWASRARAAIAKATGE